MVMCRASGMFMLLLASMSLAAVECTRHESKASVRESDSLDLQENQIQKDASAVADSTNSALTVAEDRGPSQWLTWASLFVTVALYPGAASAGGIVADGIGLPNAMAHPPHHPSRYSDYAIEVKNQQNAITGNKEWYRLQIDEQGNVIPHATNHKHDGQVAVKTMEGGTVQRVYVPLDGRTWNLEAVKKEALNQRWYGSKNAVLVELSGINVQDIHMEQSNFPAFVASWGARKLLLDLSYNGLESGMINELLKAVKKNPEAIQEIDLRRNHPNAWKLQENKDLAKEINEAAGYHKVILNDEDRKEANKEKAHRLEKEIEKAKKQNKK